MNLPKYVTIENKQELPVPCVMQTNPPFIIAKPRSFDATDTEGIEEMMSRIANDRTVAVKVKGYSVFLVFSGTLSRTFVEPRDAKEILREMADFYLREKVEAHAFKFRKSKEDGNR